MRVYVLDASVVLTFLLGKNASLAEKLSKILKQVKSGQVKLYSSYLLPLEIGNGLRYTLGDEKLAAEVLEKFLKLPINFFVFSEAQYAKILNLSYQLNTSFYDTSYHFLAKLLKGVFLTADKEYFEKAKSFGNIRFL